MSEVISLVKDNAAISIEQYFHLVMSIGLSSADC